MAEALIVVGMRVGRSPYVGPTTISHSTESCGAAQKGPAHSARLPCALTPARALVAVCLLGLVLFYLVMAAVQERMSRLEVRLHRHNAVPLHAR